MSFDKYKQILNIEISFLELIKIILKIFCQLKLNNNFAIQSSFSMENKNYQEDLLHIRQMMEKSSRFISLNGLSGVFAGIYALIGASYVYWLLSGLGIYDQNSVKRVEDLYRKSFVLQEIVGELLLVAILVLVAAVITAIVLTIRKSKKNKLKIWDKTTKRLLINFLLPLFVGGVFCLVLIWKNDFGYVAPATLIFYGLALYSGGNFTYSDIKYLGICQIALGIISLFFIGYGLFFWAFGFGVLHIVYGLVMYKKYK